MKIAATLALSLALSAALTSSAQAASPQSKSKAGRLSQLSFDTAAAEPVNKPKLDSENIRLILDGSELEAADGNAPPQAETGSKEKQGPQRKAADKQKARARLKEPEADAKTAESSLSYTPESKSVLLSPNDAAKQRYAHLSPRSHGPLTDDTQPNLLLSTQRWYAGEGGSCTEPSEERAILAKANALQEVLHRYSGSDEFYSALQQDICDLRCSQSSAQVRVTGFAVGNPGLFRITGERDNCRYELRKDESGSWVMLEGRRAVCACIDPVN